MPKKSNAAAFISDLQSALQRVGVPLSLIIDRMSTIDAEDLEKLLQKRLYTLLDRDKWKPTEALELSALFFCIYLVTHNTEK